VAGAADGERRRHADAGDDEAARGGTHDPRAVERRGEQRDRVDHVVPAHRLAHERLPHHVEERVGQARAQREDADVPVRDHARRHQRGDGERRACLRGLGGHEQASLGHAVGDGAAGEGEQQYRAPVQHVDEPQQQRRVRERQDQPGFGH